MKRVAVIDLGTHNCRMSIAFISETGFAIHRVYSKMVRLGEGAAEEGLLREDAMHRTLIALKRMADIIYEEKADEVFALATEGARMTGNAKAFFKTVKTRTGLDFRIISPREEVRLSVLSTAPLMGKAKKAIGFDIGGGSTEAILFKKTGRNLEVVDWTSLPLGVVRGRDRFGPSPRGETFKDFVAEVENAIAPFFKKNARFMKTPYRVLGTSGTVTTLTALCLELSHYDPSKVDGCKVPMAEAFRMARISAAMPLFARKLNPLIGPGRAEYLPAGCAIMEGLFRNIPAKTMVAGDRGLREGVLHSLVANAPKVSFKEKRP